MNHTPLKIVFAGTPVFAANILSSVLEEGFNITAVLTREDKPAGRGLQLHESPVKQVAKAHQLPVYQPKTLKSEAAAELIQSLEADVIVDVAFGLIVPKDVLSIPKFGFINVHSSLLPRWRGAAPIQHALLAGDKDTGVTIMWLDEGIDTGPIILQKPYHIQPNETGASLHRALSRLGANALMVVLRELEEKQALKTTPQTEEGACYASKINKAMAEIVWSHSALSIERAIRAFNDWPIAYTTLGNTRVRIWQANPLTNYTSEEPGTILKIDAGGIDVATGDGILRIQKLQFPGGKPLMVEEILNSKRALFEAEKKFGE